MVLPHEIRKQNTVIEQVIKMPHQKRIEVQNLLNTSVKVFQLTTETKDLSRKIKVAIQGYESEATPENAQIIAEFITQKKKAKDELSLAKREFMQATENYISLGGDIETNGKEEKKEGTV